MVGGNIMSNHEIEFGEYQYGFKDKDVSVFRAEKGLTREIVENRGSGPASDPAGSAPDSLPGRPAPHSG